MKKLFLITAITVIAVLLTSAGLNTSHKRTAGVKALTSCNEIVDVSIGALTGPNDVEIIFQRTGPDAGCADVFITYEVSFNGNPPNTFYKTMLASETYTFDHLQGPNPTGQADIVSVNVSY